MIEATTTPRHHHVQENDDDEDDEPNMNGDNSTDLRDNEDEIHDPVDDRLTLAERNERLQNQLRSLKVCFQFTGSPCNSRPCISRICNSRFFKTLEMPTFCNKT